MPRPKKQDTDTSSSNAATAPSAPSAAAEAFARVEPELAALEADALSPIAVDLGAAAALVLAAGLSACGGGSSDFKAKALAMCNARGGDMGSGKVDCGCAVDIMDSDLDADTKTTMLAMLNAQDMAEKDPTKAVQAMKDAGFDPTNPDGLKKLQDMQKKAEPVDEKIQAKCKKA